MLCLFNHHNEISYFQDQLKSAKDKHSAFRTAQKYNFIASAITRQKEYDEAQSKLAELRQEKEDLAFSNNSSVDTEEVKKANQINELKRYLRDARKKLEQKKNDIHLVDLNLQLGVQPTEADLNNLLTFFPNANIEKLTKIEKFHHKIQSILKDELLETKKRMEQELIPLQSQVDIIQNYIEQLKPSMAFSDEFLTAYTKLDHEITTLENECDNFINLQNLTEIKKQAKKALEERTTLLLHQMEKSINDEMEKISDFISHGEDNAPILRLLKSNSYTFETPRDSGTGTNYKGMLIYDLSILKLTPLPALAHDSLLFPNISDENLRQLLQLYSTIRGKQIFIAFDRQDNLGPDISSLLNNHAVINWVQTMKPCLVFNGERNSKKYGINDKKLSLMPYSYCRLFLRLCLKATPLFPGTKKPAFCRRLPSPRYIWTFPLCTPFPILYQSQASLLEDVQGLVLGIVVHLRVRKWVHRKAKVDTVPDVVVAGNHVISHFHIFHIAEDVATGAGDFAHVFMRV